MMHGQKNITFWNGYQIRWCNTLQEDVWQMNWAFFFCKTNLGKRTKTEDLRKHLPTFKCKMFVSKLFTKPFYARMLQNDIC